MLRYRRQGVTIDMSGKQAREDRLESNGGAKIPALVPIRMLSVDAQAKVAIVLLSVIPSLACFYIGWMVSLRSGESLPPSALMGILLCIVCAGVAGFLMLRKYAQSIAKLRRYVIEIEKKTLPDVVRLEQSASSGELRCIVEGLNMILRETERRLTLIEEKLKIESGLRKALEQQQQVLLNAERHRVMVQSIGAACHHLGQPATALRMRLYLMKEEARTVEEMEGIEQGLLDIEAIEAILKKLREVNEYRTVPYLGEGDDENQILAI